MRVAIVKSGGNIDNKIDRILTQSKIKGDFIQKVSRSFLDHYDVLIFTGQNNIPNLPKVIESIVLEKKILVLYINNTVSVGQFYNVLNDLYFNVISEQLIDIELVNILQVSIKYLDEINRLKSEKIELKTQLSNIKSANLAKRILMEKGYSEADSNKYIQQKAMNLRKSRESIVNLIIDNKIDF